MDSIRSLVVHMDASTRAERRLVLAQALALASSAQLAALYAVTPAAYDVPLALAPEAGAALLPALQALDRQRFETARATFERVTTRAGQPAAIWEDAGATPVHLALAARALTADLLIFGQHDATDAQTTTDAELIASTLIQSGTPALVLPHSGPCDAAALTGHGLSVLVAWKPTREASRAVRAGLPWLRRARHVHLAAEAVVDDGEGWPGLQALRAWLLLHGVHGELHEHAIGRASPGEMLLSMAADVSAGLLVMGCFGHSRARELVLGGASRTVLRAMTLPTLMAH